MPNPLRFITIDIPPNQEGRAFAAEMTCVDKITFSQMRYPYNKIDRSHSYTLD